MSADLDRPLAHGAHAVVEEAEVQPTIASYVGVGALTFIITLVEMALINIEALAGVMKPLLVVLLATNFLVAALYYQGLAYENATNKITFSIGLGMGVVVAVSLLVLVNVGVRVA